MNPVSHLANRFAFKSYIACSEAKFYKLSCTLRCPFFRNRAIKALDEHLKKSAEVSQASWPSLDDDEESALPKKHSNGNKDLESSNASSGEGSMSPDIVTIDMKDIQNGNISSS